MSDELYKPEALKQFDKWRELFNPLERLTLRIIVGWLYLQMMGAVADITWLYEFIERRNPTLMACVQRRTSAMEKLDWSIKTTPDDELPEGATAAMAKKQQQFLREKYRKIDNLRDAFNWMEIASFRGFSHLEKHYDETGDTCHLEPVPQWNWARAGRVGDWFYNPRAVSIFANPNAVDPQLQAIDPEDFIIREVSYPINEAIVGGYFRSVMAQKDWDAYLAAYGIPSVFIELPPDAPVDDQTGLPPAEYQAQAEKVVSNSRGVMPSGAKAQLFDGSGRGRNPFLEHITHQKEEIVLAATGGKLTMLTQGDTGALAGGAQKDTFDDIAEASAARITEDFNRQFDRPILTRQFPGQPVLAFFVLEGKEQTDASAVVKDVVDLANAGLAVDPDQIEQKTGYRVSLRDPVSKTADRAALGDATIQPVPKTENRVARFLYRLANRLSGKKPVQVDAAQQALFVAAMKKLTPAQAAKLRPLRDELKAAMDGDDAGLKARVDAVIAKLPALLRDMQLDKSTAKIIQDTLTASLLNQLVKKGVSK